MPTLTKLFIIARILFVRGTPLKHWEKEEGMPSTKALEMFVRKSELTDEEWIALIEARRKLVKPHLNSFTLIELGMLECMRTELSFAHSLQLDVSSTVGDRQFSLKTQGIFHVQPWHRVQRHPKSGYQSMPGGVSCPDGTKLVWGLTRAGLWILVTIEFKGEAGYKERGYERAKTVSIVESDITTIIAQTKVTPQEMWVCLGKAIKEFAKKREVLYHKARNLAQTVEVEELVYSLT